jgi:5-methylcytosine-specific restriction enzyme subunit McrC
MNGLRTVTVLEHEVIPVISGNELRSDADVVLAGGTFLTEAEAQALMRFNDLRRGFCQRVSGGVKLAQYCGIVRMQTCVLEVLPKIGMVEKRSADELARSRAALLIMLHSARQMAITKVGAVPQQAVQAPLLDVFIEAFLNCALEQARRGLLSRYVPHIDDLPVVKGRFLAQGHLRRNFARPHLLHCEYDEFTADNPYNRAVRTTLDVCRAWISRATTQRLWFETHARFASISTVSMTASDVARLPRERMTRRYEPLLIWCEWLLAMASPAVSAGATQAPGLLFDMNKLFEAYVSSLEEAAAGERRIVHRQGPVEPLASNGATDAFHLRPDISVWHVATGGAEGDIDRVLDAKWKRLDPHASNWGVNQADIYQLLAYALRYRCLRMELVYPRPDTITASSGAPPVFNIKVPAFADGECVRIKVRMVSLWQLEETSL